MYFIVSLLINDANMKRVVPIQWIKDLDKAKLYNYGMAYFRNKIFTTFYSPDINQDPDFGLKIRPTFDASRTSCYSSTLHQPFGMQFNL